MTPTDPLTPEQLAERAQIGADRARAIAVFLSEFKASPIEVLTSAAMAMGLFMQAAGFDTDDIAPVFLAMHMSAKRTFENAERLHTATVAGHG